MKTTIKLLLFVAILVISVLFVTNANAAPPDTVPSDTVIVAVGEPPVPPATHLPDVGTNIVLIILCGVMACVIGITLFVESHDNKDRKPDT